MLFFGSGLVMCKLTLRMQSIHHTFCWLSAIFRLFADFTPFCYCQHISRSTKTLQFRPNLVFNMQPNGSVGLCLCGQRFYEKELIQDITRHSDSFEKPGFSKNLEKSHRKASGAGTLNLVAFRRMQLPRKQQGSKIEKNRRRLNRNNLSTKVTQ